MYFFIWRNIFNNSLLVFWWGVNGYDWILLFLVINRGQYYKIVLICIMKISERIYNKNEVIIFSKIIGKFGGFLNMVSGYFLFVNEINIVNFEILY